jgi:hypothetical protein
VNRGPLERVTRAPALAAGILLAFAVAYAIWRRRSGIKKADRGEPRPTKPDRKLETATALYRALETALAAQGIHRPTSLPPLRHAQELATKSHPLASEVISLTEMYLEARFGGGSLTEAARRDFERRVREIRAHRPKPDVTAQSAAPAA